MDVQVGLLAKNLTEIDKKKNIVEKLSKQISQDSSQTDASLQEELERMKRELASLRAAGQTPRPGRQIGAWQSFETSPHSKLREAQSIARAQTSTVSEQHQQTLDQATSLIGEFSESVTKFMESEWPSFEKRMRESPLKWPDE